MPQITRCHTRRGCGGYAQVLKTGQFPRSDVVDFHRGQVVAAHQGFARCHFHGKGLQPTHPQGQRHHGTAFSLVDTGPLASQFDQLAQAQDIRPPQFIGLTNGFRLLQASHDSLRHIGDPDGLKARVRSCQRHQGRNGLQIGKQVEEFVFSSKNHAWTQDGQVESRVLQHRFSTRLAALVHRGALCVCPQGADLHQSLDTRFVHGVSNFADQGDMHLLKTRFAAVQYGHQIDDGIVPRHQTGQVGFVVN